MPDNNSLVRRVIPYDQTYESHGLQLDYVHRFKHDKFSNDFGAGGVYGRTFTKNYDQLGYHVLPPIDVRNPDFSVDDRTDETCIYTSLLNVFVPYTSNFAEGKNLYIQDNLSVWKDRVILMGGLRWTLPRGMRSIDNIFPTNTVKETLGSGSGKRTPTRYGIAIKPLPSVSVYYSSTAHNAQFGQKGFTTEDIPQPYRPQEATFEEFGAKIDHVFSKSIRLNASVAYFKNATTNIITQTGQLNSKGQLIVKQDAAGDVTKGWELSCTAQIKFNHGGHADVIANYYNADSRLAASGLTTIDAISDAYSILGRYTRTSGLLKGVMLGGGMYHQGPKRQANWKIVTPTTYDLFARYTLNKHWGFQFNMDNVTNERYVVSAILLGLAQASQPRRTRIGATYSW